MKNGFMQTFNEQGQNLKRVLHILASLNIGGAESRIMDIYRNIDRNLIQFDFVVHSSEGFYEDEARSLGAEIYQCESFTPRNLFRYIQWWRNFFHKKTYETIHGHMISSSAIYMYLAKINHVNQRILHARSGAKNGFIRSILIYIGKKQANLLLAVSKKSANAVFGYRSKVKVIYNPTNYQKYIFSEEKRREVRKTLGIQKSEFLIGHVGRFHAVKNHSFILEVFHKFSKKVNAKLVLIGDGNQKNHIFNRIDKLQIKNKVFWIKQTSDVGQYLSAMDCFIFPSKHEGFPGSLIEAQISNLPILASDTITKEVKVTQHLNYLPIQHLSVWLRKLQGIYETYQNCDRTFDNKSQFTEFNIKNVVKNHQYLYLDYNFYQENKNE